MPALVFSSFLAALEISLSMSTRPLTYRKTAAEAETEKTTQPAGRVSLGERISRVETPFPQRDLIDWVCEVTVPWEIES